MNTTTCTDPEQLPQALIEALHQARRVAVLTGAGVSADSGIPTFRDAQTGVWEHFDPMELASPEGFSNDPATVWEWYQWRRELIGRTRPNAGHHALVELATRVPRLDLITQNVDGFHRLAGSDPVLELHGNIQRSICSRTRREIDADWLATHADHKPPPSPHHPDGLARPDVVWFGEALDEDVLRAAFEIAEGCDLMLVAGTSGAVQPAASLPAIAARAGAAVIEINPQRSELTALARWHLAGPSVTWLPALAASLETH
ncbi:MAG TPA: NAD-dependent protein deacylase [Wenzhouxiangella sp.]|nr:NAD-dependent protein deacylase [Wenzhouxiangella sp.]